MTILFLWTLQNFTSNSELALTEAILGHRGFSAVRYFWFFYSSFSLDAFWSSAALQSLTWQWGQLQQVRSKPKGRHSLTLCSPANPFSLMEAQSKDCCNSWHIRSYGTNSLHTGFCRNTTGISAPSSGLSSFQWLQVTKKKSVCVWGENTTFCSRWTGSRRVCMARVAVCSVRLKQCALTISWISLCWRWKLTGHHTKTSLQPDSCWDPERKRILTERLWRL